MARISLTVSDRAKRTKCDFNVLGKKKYFKSPEHTCGSPLLDFTSAKSKCFTFWKIIALHQNLISEKVIDIVKGLQIWYHHG